MVNRTTVELDKKLARPDQCAAPRGKGTRPRALTAEALPPPYGIAYDARPPTVDLIYIDQARRSLLEIETSCKVVGG